MAVMAVRVAQPRSIGKFIRRISTKHDISQRKSQVAHVGLITHSFPRQQMTEATMHPSVPEAPGVTTLATG